MLDSPRCPMLLDPRLGSARPGIPVGVGVGGWGRVTAGSVTPRAREYPAGYRVSDPESHWPSVDSLCRRPVAPPVRSLSLPIPSWGEGSRGRGEWDGGEGDT